MDALKALWDLIVEGIQLGIATFTLIMTLVLLLKFTQEMGLWTL